MNLRNKCSICSLISGIRGILLSQVETIITISLLLCKTEYFYKMMNFFTQDDPELKKVLLLSKFCKKKYIVGPKNR